MTRSAAEILREYGPFPGVDHVHGVTFDGRHVWFAAGDRLNAFDPASGKTMRAIDAAAHAGTAFDGQFLFQLAEDADSDEVAQAIRDDVAQGSEMISPGSGASLAGIFLALAEGWSSVRAAG
ncbi:MAG TPA: hypothetical protein VJ770_13975, partial [Stellaceae bacterium]|nr:hypothetical protein [Stellaceae bacterium]